MSKNKEAGVCVCVCVCTWHKLGMYTNKIID